MNQSTIYNSQLPLRGKVRSVIAQVGHRSGRVVLALAVLVAIGLGPARFAAAQGIAGSITGTVTDSAGAAIVGATVTIKNLDTNATHVVTTSAIGSYTAPQLVPGHYSVKAVKPGFKAFEDDSITLQIDQVASINPSLSVGSENTTVEVTLAPPAIQTDSSSIGEVIDSVAIQSAPLNGRLSLMGLIAQAPGVQGVGPQDQLATRGETFAVGTGSRNSYGSLGSTFDGVTNAEVTLQRAEPEVPSLDAISEFKVLTSSAPAEFGQPIQVIVVSASGSNKYHGERMHAD